MDCQIIEKPSFKVIGRALRVGMKDGENTRRIPEFWQECLGNGGCDQIAALSINDGIAGPVMLGICTDFDSDMSAFTYMIAVETAAASVPEGMIAKTIPAAAWAIFEGRGAPPEAIQSLWKRIMSEFLPAGDYDHAAGPDLEVYHGDNEVDFRFEIWIPVVKK